MNESRAGIVFDYLNVHLGNSTRGQKYGYEQFGHARMTNDALISMTNF